MILLHTSDWHLGQTLCEHSRMEEHKQFLDWLKGVLVEQRVDALLICGDIFDTPTPSNVVKKMYYDFLAGCCRLPECCLRYVIVIGGNHDSPAVLDNTVDILALNDIRVLGRAAQNIEDEVLVLREADGRPGLVLCAVPFLRDWDLPRGSYGDDPLNYARDKAAGVVQHFECVRAAALKRLAGLGVSVPLAAMGHLFATGVSLEVERDGEQVTVGTLGEVDASSLAAGFDYVALGHIHSPRKVSGWEHVRYCGSPIPMDFGEIKAARRADSASAAPDALAGQPDKSAAKVRVRTQAGKKVLLVHFEADSTAEPSRASNWRGHVRVEPLEVPVFRKLIKWSADDLKALKHASKKLAAEALEQNKLPAWVHVDYTGTKPPADWRDQLDVAAGFRLSAKSADKSSGRLTGQPSFEFLARRDLSQRNFSAPMKVVDVKQLTEEEVFDLCLEQQNIVRDSDMWRSCKDCYAQVMASLAQYPDKLPGDDEATGS